jgi:uncharacterized protein (TIGR03032 family)
MIPDPLKITLSANFLTWLLEQNLSLALTTYQIGKLFLFGVKNAEQLSVFERNFNRCMGLYATENSLYMSSLFQIWRFENALNKDQEYQGFDRLYIPQLAYTCGAVDTHDLAVTSTNQIIFINSLYSCLAAVSSSHSFKLLWKPKFIDQVIAEDRCHLNGLALKHGQPAYVTAIAATNTAQGWREQRLHGGLVMSVADDEIIATELSMPHSPRWYADKLWLLNSGSGEFGYIELNTGRFIPVCFCSGYLRGLAFYGNFAVIGLSKPRQNQTLSGLSLEKRLQNQHQEAECGLDVIDLRSGQVVHQLRIEGLVSEVYDIVTLARTRRPMVLGFKTDEIQRLLTIEN